jgi:predicted metal-dependent enzyme (double-stranded beta helix superfamily)
MKIHGKRDMLFTPERRRIEAHVAGVLDSLACRPNLALLADRLSAADGLRTWSRLVCTDEFDAWLIAWGSWSEVGAHDHGDSGGAIRVLRGALEEIYREAAPDAARDDGWRRRTLRPGRSIVIPPSRVHGVANPAARPAVSLHVYSPPLQQMNFLPKEKRLEVSA